MIYVDNNATTAVDFRVLRAMLPYFCEVYGNPHSLHRAGTAASHAVMRAYGHLYSLLGAEDSDSVLLTSGSTESNNTVVSTLCHAAETRKHGPLLCVTSAIEHPSVTNSLEAAQKRLHGALRVVQVSPGKDGVIHAQDIDNALQKGIRESAEPALVSVMWANNETGAVNDVRAIAATAHRYGALFHTDATQIPGKYLPARPSTCSARSSPYILQLHDFADFASVSGHKFHGPKGIGALYVRSGAARRMLTPLLFGGEQKAGLRAGTVNVAGAVGLGEAARLLLEDRDASTYRKVLAMRDKFEATLKRESQKRKTGARHLHIICSNVPRVCNTSLVSAEGVEGEALLYDLNERGICASTGSACASEDLRPSPVLSALEQLSSVKGLAHTGVRISFSRMNNSRRDPERVAKAILTAVDRLSQFSTTHE